MGEKDNPVIVDKLMKVDWAIGSIGLKIWRN
jgi:hypothetical protein